MSLEKRTAELIDELRKSKFSAGGEEMTVNSLLFCSGWFAAILLFGKK